MRVKFTVLGDPTGKQRHRTTRSGHTYTPDKTARYENLVKVEYRRQCGVRFPDDAQLDVRILAYHPIPTSTSKKKRKLMEERVIRPAKKPDWDNIGKIVTDSLNQVAYRDDAQVVDAQVRKFYSERPRIEVIIQEASA